MTPSPPDFFPFAAVAVAVVGVAVVVVVGTSVATFPVL